MAAEAEGITLLSMYNDDEGDEEDACEEKNEISINHNPRSELPVRDNALQMLISSPIRTKNGADSTTLRSPLETEEEEKEGSGCILMGTEIQGYDGDSGGTTPITSKTLTPNNQYECLQPSDVPDLSKTKFSMDMDCTGFGREVVGVETSASISSDLQKDDPLQKFLPPALIVQCSEELQEKIKKFLAYKRAGKSFNAYLRKKKDYRNPDFLQHAVRYQDIEQIGTCFGKETFDPHGYDKSDFYDEIEADMKREMERKAQERKRSQKIDFVSGGIQSGEAALVALKMNSKIPTVGISTVINNEFQPVSTTVDAVRDGRLNKKSKWDKE